MFKTFSNWYQKYFSSEEVIVLLLLIAFSAFVIAYLGRILAPVFTALVVAFLLQGLVTSFMARGLPKLLSVILVYLLFLSLLVASVMVLLPLAWGQLVSFVELQLPRLLIEVQSLVELLPQKFPEMISQAQIDEWVTRVKTSVNFLSNELLSFSFSILPNIMGILIFLILVPVLVFFFLKDKDRLINYLVGWLPDNREMLRQVWQDMNRQVSNYVRGKFIEIVIVGLVTYFALVYLGVNYAVLLAILVGFSVVIPFIGAAVITLPIALVGYFQFGFGSELATLIVVYGVIQALDGNVLVPLLFSDAVNLHPVSIIVAVLLFGGLWGLWGVFFAIPLATLIKSVATAWSLHIKKIGGAPKMITLK